MKSRHNTKRKAPLPPPTEFLTLEEVAARWRRVELTTERLLKKHGVQTYRLSAKLHLYRLSDIVALEEAARTRPPLLNRTTWSNPQAIPKRKEAVTQ